ncbi:MAG: hypothetical protein APF81_14455 [Desulfosporosinus sp. BRH_c37]|nr:MAG: hypothetical protein APF81_14455 [Desulfosporosinus sp. BRH_c37]
MAGKATKAAESVFYGARIEAAAFNDNFNSREGAAEVIGMDRTRLARIELGSINPYPEEVLMMMDAYNAPELGNYHCSRQCPLGKQTVPQIEVAELDRLTIQILSSFQRIDRIKDTLIDITTDGVINMDERPKLAQVMAALDMISANAQSLKLWAEKNLK